INTRLEWDVISLIAEEYDMQAEKVSELGDELYSFEDSSEDIKQAEKRAPVVTIMGHVDHGKTSLLDYIRKENVVAGESGGITQHIGAHKVELPDSKSITFLDTPGHEAFTAMRARGAQITDIVVLVVAADDSVMPQTVEAIDHAKVANVPIVVAVNKMDKPGIDLDKVKRELSDHKVLVEDWGGKVQCIPTSAKTGDGVPDLLNAILMEAELLELKANRNTLAKATVVDSKLDKGYGPIATILIQKGTLKVGDPFICNDYSGKVRSILNERGHRLKLAFPSDAIQVLGFEQVPQVADIFSVVENERELKRISTDRQRLRRSINQKKVATRSLDAMSAMIKEGAITQLALIVKGDVDGSIEALSDSLIKLNTDEVAINIIHKSVGMVIESDVLLADASKAVIIGFNVQISSNAKLQAKQAGVEIRNYKIIYNAVEDIKLALEGLLAPEEKEEILGRALVQTQFKIPKIGFIAGAKVEEGVMRRNSMARLIRDDEILFDDVEISSLKRFKDDAKEIKEGLECGIGLTGVSKYKENDIIVAFKIQKIKRKLADS
ncbi:translation initiation factor IF-2, partial [Candidatus Neomarinimicrobiota bacterium]